MGSHLQAAISNLPLLFQVLFAFLGEQIPTVWSSVGRYSYLRVRTGNSSRRLSVLDPGAGNCPCSTGRQLIQNRANIDYLAIAPGLAGRSGRTRLSRASVDREIQPAKIGRDPSARQSQRITQRQNCCPKPSSAKLPRLLANTANTLDPRRVEASAV